MTGGRDVTVAVYGGSKMGTDDQRVRLLLIVLFMYWIELNLISLSSLVGAVEEIVYMISGSDAPIVILFSTDPARPLQSSVDIKASPSMEA
jgi:hypothetical protein